MRNHKSPTRWIFAGWLGVCWVFTGCSRETYTPVCEVAKLANQSPGTMDGKLGRPVKVVPIPGSFSQKPGEYREYVLSDGSHLQARFYEGRAVSFTLTLKDPVPSPEAAIRVLGLESNDLTVTDRLDTAKTWRGTVGGVNFDTITASTAVRDLSSWAGVDLRVHGSPE